MDNPPHFSFSLRSLGCVYLLQSLLIIREVGSFDDNFGCHDAQRE